MRIKGEVIEKWKGKVWKQAEKISYAIVTHDPNVANFLLEGMPARGQW